jgi:hypothetical protein
MTLNQGVGGREVRLYAAAAYSHENIATRYIIRTDPHSSPLPSSPNEVPQSLEDRIRNYFAANNFGLAESLKKEDTLYILVKSKEDFLKFLSDQEPPEDVLQIIQNGDFLLLLCDSGCSKYDEGTRASEYTLIPLIDLTAD